MLTVMLARVRIALAVGALVLLGLRAAQAQNPTDQSVQNWDAAQSEQCDLAIREAEEHYHLPAGLLAAMAKVESGRPVGPTNEVRPWPWTIDADGLGLFLDSKTAAVVWVDQQQPHHRYIDVGCLQVDLRLHPEAFASLDEAFDPKSNVDFAARFLEQLYQGEARRNWNLAVGLYHSHMSIVAAGYRDRVSETGARVLNGVLDPVPLFVRAVRQGTLEVPLGGGRFTPINVQRQPALHRRHLSSCQIARELGGYLNKATRPAC